MPVTKREKLNPRGEASRCSVHSTQVRPIPIQLWPRKPTSVSALACSRELTANRWPTAKRPALGHESKVGKVSEWFNTSNYTQPPYGFYGTASPGSIRGPAEFTGNTALYKTFPVGEKVNLQFRAEAFNIANHPSYAAASTNYGAGNFGAVTSALDPRTAVS
jgi:hypothetical protein